VKLFDYNANATKCLSSACVSHVGFGVSPKRTSAEVESLSAGGRSKEKSATARTPSPARETRALPNRLN
jgi:hypothetical protein